MLDEHDTKATFFTLGWIAERYPLLVRLIVDQGHELASHGYGHERASELTEAAFFADINLRQACCWKTSSGNAVQRLPRARAFRSAQTNLWAFDCLARAGYRYSSSIYPIAHDHYGMPDSPRFATPCGPG